MTEPNSGLTIPIILRDAMGREMEVQAPMNADQVHVGLGPIGCFIFERTSELHPSLRTVYVQSNGRSMAEAAAKSLIDVN